MNPYINKFCIRSRWSEIWKSKMYQMFLLWKKCMNISYYNLGIMLPLTNVNAFGNMNTCLGWWLLKKSAQYNNYRNAKVIKRLQLNQLFILSSNFMYFFNCLYLVCIVFFFFWEISNHIFSQQGILIQLVLSSYRQALNMTSTNNYSITKTEF